MDEYAFQDLIVDLLSREPDLCRAQLYGERGQKQFGGDAIAHCRDGGKALAQCKRSKKLQPVLIARACDEFVANLSHWRQEDIRRFILAVTQDATSPKVITEIRRQETRLKKKRIAFEVWHRPIIVQKARLHPDLVHQHFGGSQTWVDRLCGPQPPRPQQMPPSTSDVERLLLQEMLAEFVEKEVKALREALRRGQRTEVRTKLAALQQSPARWASLNAEVQAAVLRLQVGLELDSDGNLGKAKALLEAAQRLDPKTSVVRLETRIRLQQSGPAVALDELPSDDDAATLCARGSLLLLLGRTEESWHILESAHQRDPEDVDTLRLLALVQVIRGNVPLAHQHLAELARVAPGWEIVRQTRAAVLYVSALCSPHFQNPASFAPEPVEWAFIRRDDASLRYLEEAAALFQELAADLDRPLAERQMLEVWRLACLANHPKQQKLAAEYCAELVKKHPCNIYTFPWANARGYSVDIDRVAHIARQTMESDALDMRPVLLLAGCMLHLGDTAGPQSLLEQQRSRFEQKGQMQVWRYWWAMLQFRSNDIDGALDFIRASDERDNLAPIEIAALHEQAKRTGDASSLIERLGELYSRTGKPRYFLHVAEQHAHAGNWAAIAERSPELLRLIPTQDALYLALMADFNTRRYERCLSRTEAYRHFFPLSQIPIDIRRLRVECLHRLRRAKEALSEATALQEDDASTASLARFTMLCAGYGDIERAILAERELLERQDLSAEDAVEIAQSLMAYSPDLSRRLLGRVKPAQIPSGQLFTAFSLGQRLAIEEQQRELWERITALAAEEPSVVKAVSVEELLKLIEHAHQARAEDVRLYQLGQVPVHQLVDRHGLDITSLYVKHRDAPSRPAESSPVFVRHGKRVTGQVRILPRSTRVNLDITTIILIQQFNIWDAFQRTFDHLRCSSLVIPLLQHLLERTLSSEPVIEEAQRAVLRLWQEGHIQIGNAGTACSLENPSHDNASEVNLRAVAEDLRCRGYISAAECESALRVVAKYATAPVRGSLPTSGSRIRCPVESAVRLAAAGILQPLTTAFDVIVEPDEITALQAAVAASDQSHKRAEWIKGLVGALGEMLRAGKLSLLPAGNGEPNARTLSIAALCDLFSFVASRADVICVDDRFANGFLKRAGSIRTPIMCIYDLLPALVERGGLAQDRMWEIVQELRMADCWFLPLQAEEIVHRLMAAGIREGDVIETPEMRVLRQYTAACFTRADLLQRGDPGLPNQLGEIEFIQASRHAVTNSLALLWTSEQQSEDALHARVRWLIESLYVEVAGIRRILGFAIQADLEREILALDALILLLLGWSSVRSGRRGKAKASGYITWVWNSMFQQRCNADAGLLDAIVARFERQFHQILSGEKPPKREEVADGLLRVARELPEPLRTRLWDRLRSTPEFASLLHSVVTVGDLRFLAAEYTVAVATALRTGSAAARDLRSGEEVVIRRISPDCWTQIDVEQPVRRQVHRLHNAFWGLLLPTRADRETALRRNRPLFDMRDDAFEDLVQHVLGSEDDLARMESVTAAASESTPYLYEVLHSQIRFREGLSEADLIPHDGQSFLKYFGIALNVEAAIPTFLEGAAAELMSRVGTLEAMGRFAALPTPLPRLLEAAYVEDSFEQQGRYLHAVLRAGVSPVHRFHALRLACLGKPGPSRTRLHRYVVNHLLSGVGFAEREAHLSVVRWSVNAFARWHGARSWPRAIRLLLAWAHGSVVFGLYLRQGAPPYWLAREFSGHKRFEPLADLEHDFVYGRDAADPAELSAETLAVNGLAYALSPDHYPLPYMLAYKARQEWFTSGQNAPPVPFLEDPAACPNVLGSFLGRDRLHDLANLIGPDLATEFTPEWRSGLREQALAAIRTEEHRVTGWGVLNALYRDRPLPEAITSPITECLKELDLCVLAERGRQGAAMRILPAVAPRIAQLRDEGARNMMTASLIRLAEWYGANSGTAEEARDLLGLVLAHAYPVPTKKTSPEDFGDLCLRVAATFPKFAAGCRDVVDRLCRDLAVERAADFWPLNVRLRAIDQGSLP